MDFIDHESTKTLKSKTFATDYFTHRYWQILLATDSRIFQSIITPDGIFSPIRVLHGTTNACLHLQAFLIMKLPPELLERAFLLLDDCLFNEETTESLLRDLRRIFEFCVAYIQKLNPSKCYLYMTEAHWCSRITSSNGIRHNPFNVDGLPTWSAGRPEANFNYSFARCSGNALPSSIFCI